MIIPSRRVGEDIAVPVLGVTGSSVRIGVNAPQELAVQRKEVYVQIQPEQHSSSRITRGR